MEEAQHKPWFTDEDLEYYARYFTGGQEDSQRDFRTLLATISEVLGETDLDTLLRKLVEHVLHTTQTERGILLLEDGGRLRVRVAFDHKGADLGRDPPMARTVAESVFHEGRPIIQSVTDQHDVLQLSHSAAALRLRQVMCAALRARGEKLGVIYVDGTMRSTGHTEADLKLFHAQAGLIGMAVENHRLFQEAWEARDAQRQLEVAREIQERLYPRSPARFGDTELAGLTEICDRVGGDYFDFLALEEPQGVCVGIGDVSGHGIAPALIMSDVRARVRSLLRARGVMSGMYGSINQALCAELPVGMYVALFIAVYHPDAGVLEYQNAGHVAPIHYSPATDTFQEIRPNAPALGVFDDMSAGPCPELRVQKGDYLVCYTDGVVDRPDSEGEHYGVEKLKETIRKKAHEGASPSEVTEAIREAAAAHAGDRSLRDDFTLLVARL